MPNYGLVVTPTYNPMSYEQYIQPFKDYAQVYNATVDQIDALEMEANQWERLADSDIDAPQYQQYKSYADDLRKYANEIATQGLSSRTRAGLSRMRQRYAKAIKPIEDAFNRRQEAIKAEDALLAKDPSLVLAGSARNIGLGQYMAGTPQVYGVSGDDVYKKTLAAFQSISSRKYTYDEARALGNNYYQISEIVGESDPVKVMQYLTEAKNNLGIASNLSAIGFTPDKLNEVYEYAQAMDNILKSTNYDKLDTTGRERIIQSSLAGGLTGLVYKEDRDYQQNPYAFEYSRQRAGYDANVSPEQIVGYEQKIGDTTYTVVNESGELKYYNTEGKPVQLTAKQIEEANKTSPYVRYTIRETDKKGIYSVYDKVKNMYVDQDDGQHIKFDITKQDWSAKDRKIVNKPQSASGKSTKYQINSDEVLVAEFDEKGNKIQTSLYKYADAPKFAGDDGGVGATGIKEYNGEKIKETHDLYGNKDIDALKANGVDEKIIEYLELYNKLPENVKSNPGAYVILYGRKTGSHNRILKASPKKHYSEQEGNIVEEGGVKQNNVENATD